MCRLGSVITGRPRWRRWPCVWGTKRSRICKENSCGPTFKSWWSGPGLGCVGSGGIILAAEVALRMGTNPSIQDETTLYGVCACEPPEQCQCACLMSDASFSAPWGVQTCRHCTVSRCTLCPDIVPHASTNRIQKQVWAGIWGCVKSAL